MAFWNSPTFGALLRPLATALHRLLRSKRHRTSGAHAFALTPHGKIILVKLRYAPGWRLPGGGRHEDEELREAVLRELREEIGMISHGPVRPAGGDLMIVEEVRYSAPRWSWEVEAIREAELFDLPRDLSRPAAEWIAAARDTL